MSEMSETYKSAPVDSPNDAAAAVAGKASPRKTPQKDMPQKNTPQKGTPQKDTPQKSPNRPPVRTPEAALPAIDAAARCQKIAEDDLRTPIELPHDAADFELDELRSDVAQQRAELAAQAEARAALQAQIDEIHAALSTALARQAAAANEATSLAAQHAHLAAHWASADKTIDDELAELRVAVKAMKDELVSKETVARELQQQRDSKNATAAKQAEENAAAAEKWAAEAKARADAMEAARRQKLEDVEALRAGVALAFKDAAAALPDQADGGAPVSPIPTRKRPGRVSRASPAKKSKQAPEDIDAAMVLRMHVKDHETELTALKAEHAVLVTMVKKTAMSIRDMKDGIKAVKAESTDLEKIKAEIQEREAVYKKELADLQATLQRLKTVAAAGEDGQQKMMTEALDAQAAQAAGEKARLELDPWAAPLAAEADAAVCAHTAALAALSEQAAAAKTEAALLEEQKASNLEQFAAIGRATKENVGAMQAALQAVSAELKEKKLTNRTVAAKLVLAAPGARHQLPKTPQHTRPKRSREAQEENGETDAAAAVKKPATKTARRKK